MTKFTIENGNLVIKIPMKTRRYNCYEADADPNYVGEEMQSIYGERDKNGTLGFGHLLDMSYKGSGDQTTGILYHWDGSEEDFTAFCKENKIPVYYNIPIYEN